MTGIFPACPGERRILCWGSPSPQPWVSQAPCLTEGCQHPSLSLSEESLLSHHSLCVLDPLMCGYSRHGAHVEGRGSSVEFFPSFFLYVRSRDGSQLTELVP